MKKVKGEKKKEPSPSEKLNAVGIEAICERIANVEYYHKIAEDIGVSRTALMNYLGEHEDMYARAKEARADKIAEDILHIADDGGMEPLVVDGLPIMDASSNPVMVGSNVAVQHAKLRVDARKWLASKMLPKKYGDKLELAGDKESPLTVQIVRLSDADKPD